MHVLPTRLCSSGHARTESTGFDAFPPGRVDRISGAPHAARPDLGPGAAVHPDRPRTLV